MKIGELYDLDSVKQFNDCWAKFTDASGGLVLERNLTYVDPSIFEKKFPDLAFMNSGVTLDNSGGFAQQVQSLRIVDEGGFANVSDKAANKGKISLRGEDNFISVIERMAGSEWSTTELEQAKLQNINLPARYISAFNKIYQREIDEAGLLGLNGATGLLNHTGYTADAASDVIGNLTAAEMYSTYADFITAQWNGVNNTEDYKATTVITPVYCVNRLQTTILNAAGSTKSVFGALMDNFTGINILGSFRADTAAGTGSSTVAVNVSGESMKMRIPQPLRMGEVIKVGAFHYETEGMYRVAGVDILEDTAGRRLTGL